MNVKVLDLWSSAAKLAELIKPEKVDADDPGSGPALYYYVFAYGELADKFFGAMTAIHGESLQIVRLNAVSVRIG